MENYPEDYSPVEYFDGWGSWHRDQLVPVPGFGFFPTQMKEELEEEAQVALLIDNALSAFYSFLASFFVAAYFFSPHFLLPTISHSLFCCILQHVILLLQAFLREVSE